jgi:hypothetical protein
LTIHYLIFNHGIKKLTQPVSSGPQPIFTAFGLYWSLDDVHWAGAPTNEQRLWGRKTTRLTRRGRPTNVEIATREDYSKFIGLYCLYRDARLIYVGEAGLGNKSNLYKRLKQHQSDHLADQWDEFSWFGRPAEEKEKETSAKDGFAQMEALLIAVINPGSNKQGGTFVGATQVFQVPNEHAEGDVDTKLGRLMAKLEEIDKRLPLLTEQPLLRKRGKLPKGL